MDRRVHYGHAVLVEYRSAGTPEYWPRAPFEYTEALPVFAARTFPCSGITGAVATSPALVGRQRGDVNEAEAPGGATNSMALPSPTCFVVWNGDVNVDAVALWAPPPLVGAQGSVRGRGGRRGPRGRSS
jgi:hypothetical protein